VTKNASILFLICYGLLLSGSIFSVGHELLHATSNITGIHQHEVQQHATATHSHHHHHISDHGTLFNDIFTLNEESKKFFTNMVFLAFYYETTIQFDFEAFCNMDVNYFLYDGVLNSHQLSPITPPPDHFH
jgi:hypothetical protein